MKHVIPPLINQDGTPLTDEQDKATILNDHFINQTRLDTQDKDIPRLNDPIFSFPQLVEVQVTEHEALKILNSLDASKSSGLDNVPKILRKMCALLITRTVCKLFNKSPNRKVSILLEKGQCITNL